MGKVDKYRMPPSLGKSYTWKDVILIPTVVLALFFGGEAYLKWRDPSLQLERSHLYGVAYSHPVIREITGGTSTASFALVPKEEQRWFARVVPEDWKRKKENDTIHGKARMLIFGKGGGGIFTLTYRYVSSSDSFVIIQIESLNRPLLQEGPSRASQTNDGAAPVVSDQLKLSK